MGRRKPEDVRSGHSRTGRRDHGPPLDSTEIPVYGQQENSAYNGHFESTCYHPLLLFNREGDCLAAKLRPGNVHSADDWEEVLLPEVVRQQKHGGDQCYTVSCFDDKMEIPVKFLTRWY